MRDAVGLVLGAPLRPRLAVAAAGEQREHLLQLLLLVSKHVWHDEHEQGHQLHEVVLQRRAGEQEAPPAAEVEQELPPLALEVLDMLRLVEDEVVP